MVQFNAGPLRTFKAGADLSAAQYHIAKLDTSNENQVLLATAGTDPIAGVIDGFAKDGSLNDAVSVRKGGFSAKVIMGATCNIGDKITAGTGGKGAVTTTDGDFVVGRALQASGADGDIIEVELIMGFYAAP